MPVFLKYSNFRFIVSSITRHYSKTASINSNLYELLLRMPKDQKHIWETQKQRVKIKQRSAKYSPGNVSLQVVGTGAKGAPRSVYLFSDQSRYLFNCGEGTQRLAHEHKTKLAKLEQIFITQSTWKNIGGLPGTALTIQDVGVPEITLHGPAGLNEIFPATRRFVILRDLKIKMAECSQETHFKDNVMSVKYVPLVRTEVKIAEKGPTDQDIQVAVEQNDVATSTRNEKRSRKRSSSKSRNVGAIVEDNTDYYAHERKKSRKRHRSRSRSQSQDPENGKKLPFEIPSITRSLMKQEAVSMCFVCQLQPRPGALNLHKCVDKGVPPGPLLGKLKNGEDVTLSNGVTVKSSEVCEPDDPGPVFIVVDCPSAEYLECLTTNPELRSHQKYADKDEDAACLVVHFTPPEVMQLPQYKAWMNDFSASTYHLPVNEFNTCMGSIAVHRIQHKLHMLSPDFFPLLGDQGTPVLQRDPAAVHQSKKLKTEEMNFGNLKIGNDSKSQQNLVSHSRIGSLSRFNLRPAKGLDSDSHISLDIQEYIEETMSVEEFPNALKELQQTLQSAKINLTVRDYPKILFLGTGSCIPNKTRNTSGILLQTSENKNILLDCGEGTCGQILRFFGPEKGDKVLTEIEAVYVSHLHADHHIGLIGLLQGRRKALDRLNIDKDPLYLFAPAQILAWLSFYNGYFESIEDEYTLIPNGDLIFDENKPRRREVLDNLDLCDISTCLVRHCPNAFGVSLVHKSGYKITYSGDTMPSENLVQLGKNSDLLIHEATMEDELIKEAVQKMHSTTSQAIQVGQEMQAKHIILTHFSQRYAKLPRFNDNFTENVSIAFDNMQVKLDELPLVPLLYPALKIMFAEHYEELEHKAVKRQQKEILQRELTESLTGTDRIQQSS